jgi:hypothetical protein
MSEVTRAADQRRVIAFEGLNELTSKWTFRVIGVRCPNRGDFFLSGAIPQAYKARQHLTMEYQIVEPIAEYTIKQVWVRK